MASARQFFCPRDYVNSFQPLSIGSPAATLFCNWDGSDSGQLWLSQIAASESVKTFAADAWSPPGCMKTNYDDTYGNSLCGVTNTSCASGDWRQAYANYIVQCLLYYKASGIEVTYVGFVNESELCERYASINSNGTQSADFLCS
jgi:O-glycosyl hydrolase